MTIRIEWLGPNEYKEVVAFVPARDYRGTGRYRISITQRPSYCDRGAYLVLVDSEGIEGLDDQEGFPRYYFDFEVAKSEMERWVNKRDSCLKAEREGRT